MILMLCLDEGGGMAFHHRRQSRDRALIARILAFADGRPLWMSPATAKLFDPLPANARVDERCLAQAGPGELCFAETTSPEPYWDRVEQLVLYRWNRLYPSDLKPELPLSTWQKRSGTDFPGHSHGRITEEIYIP